MGLGNPGKQYEGSRHNAGFECLEKLAFEFGVPFKKPFFSSFSFVRVSKETRPCLLIKPLTYMNRSGEIIPSIQRKWDITASSFVCVCDTLDLPPGSIRLKKGGGSAGHRGLSSVIQYLGSSDFLRVYIGIGRPKERERVAEYVLERPAEAEIDEFTKGISAAAEACMALTHNSREEVMGRYNRRLKEKDVSKETKKKDEG